MRELRTVCSRRVCAVLPTRTFSVLVREFSGIPCMVRFLVVGAFWGGIIGWDCNVNTGVY